MSAGFHFAGHVYWGTNGAVELCLEKLIEAAGTQDGPDDLLPFLQEQREGFFMGAVVFLDDVLASPQAKARFAGLLELAMAKMTAEEQLLTDYGREWVRTVLSELRAAVWSLLP